MTRALGWICLCGGTYLFVHLVMLAIAEGMG